MNKYYEAGVIKGIEFASHEFLQHLKSVINNYEFVLLEACSSIVKKYQSQSEYFKSFDTKD